MVGKNMEIRKTYKVRLYPNKAQEQEFLKVLGACRFVWNHFLDLRNKHYQETGGTISYAVLSRELTKLRHQIDWMEKVNSNPVHQSLRELESAYRNFFKKVVKFPKFKSKMENRQSFISRDYRFEGNKIQIYRNLKIRFRGTAPIKPKGMMRVVLDSGRWYACIPSVEEIKPPRRYTKPIGIDLGLTHLAITSKGDKYDNPRFERKSSTRAKSLQQTLSRKKKGSNRRQKAKVELSRLHSKITNRRKNHIHQITHRIASKNHALIATEDLSVSGMMRNHHLARSIADVAWSEFTRQLQYKQEWRGGEFVKIGRFYPSSKTCSNCRFVQIKMPLSVRNWRCTNCKKSHDRDINAAKVILAQALAHSVHRG